MADDDRQPPQNLAAEQALLGAVMLSATVLEETLDKIRTEDFYRPAHATIWAAVLDMYAGGDPVDVVTVADHLGRSGDLLRVGGAPYLHTLIQDVPVATSAGYYARIVRRAALQRRGVELGVRIVQMSEAWPSDEDGLAERIAAEAGELAPADLADSSVIGLDDAVDSAFDRLAGPVPPSIPTGLVDLDNQLTGGLRPGDVYVIAARPGLGKSLVGANIALNVAESQIGVLVCSLEMTSAEVTNRLLANAAGVHLTALMRHQLNDLDWHQLRKTRDRLRGTPLRIRDTPDTTMAGIRRQCEREMRRATELGLLVVDYAQLVAPADPNRPRQEQVAEISRASKRLAGDLEIPVILISQTNRRDAERAEPEMSDLRESGSLESDASAVIILRRPQEPERAGELDAFVVKNRHGEEGRVSLAYSPRFSRVRSLARAYEGEVAA